MTIGWKTDEIFLKAERHKKLPRERNDADLSEGVEAQESPMDVLSREDGSGLYGSSMLSDAAPSAAKASW